MEAAGQDLPQRETDVSQAVQGSGRGAGAVLLYHKKFEGAVPITFVDTRLYEGGHDDYYEALSPT